MFFFVLFLVLGCEVVLVHKDGEGRVCRILLGCTFITLGRVPCHILCMCAIVCLPVYLFLLPVCRLYTRLRFSLILILILPFAHHIRTRSPQPIHYSQTFENKSSFPPPNPPAGLLACALACAAVVDEAAAGVALLQPPKSSSPPHAGLLAGAAAACAVVVAGAAGVLEAQASFPPQASMLP